MKKAVHNILKMIPACPLYRDSLPYARFNVHNEMAQ